MRYFRPIFLSFFSIRLSFQKVGWIGLQSGGDGGHSLRLINLLPNFSFEKSWTILAHLNKNRSVFIHNTIDFGKKLLFRVFCECFGIEFQTLYVLQLTFKKTASKRLSKLHKQKPLPFLTVYWCDGKGDLNIMFIFKSIDTTVLTVLSYSFFDWTTFPKSTCQGSGSFCSSFFRTWTYFYHSFTGVFFDLSWRHVAIRIIFLLTD